LSIVSALVPMKRATEQRHAGAIPKVAVWRRA
jgi:hypothetical protein